MNTLQLRLGKVSVEATPGRVVVGNVPIAPFRRAEVRAESTAPVQFMALVLAILLICAWWVLVVIRHPAMFVVLGLVVALHLLASACYVVAFSGDTTDVTFERVDWPIVGYLRARQQCARLNAYVSMEASL